MAVIEHHEDDPDAVETMIRHLYNFPYPKQTTDGPEFHFNNFVAAKKYLLNDLESIALAGVLDSIESVQSIYRRSKDITGIFELRQLLSIHRDQHEDFSVMASQLARKHLGSLVTIPEFRKMLDEDENKGTLDLVVNGVQTDHEDSHVPDGGQGERESALCPTCRFMWAPAAPAREYGCQCPRCSLIIISSHHFSRWRRV